MRKSTNHSAVAGILLALCSAAPILGQVAPEPSPAYQTTADSSASDQTVKMEPFQVGSTLGEGYITENSARAFKTNQSILDIPQPVMVVTQDMIQDTGMTVSSDVLQYVGVANSFEGETTAMRGSRDNDPYIDDQPDAVPYEDDVFVDSYEIIHGASSVLYPQATLTGLVIKVTKKALPYRQEIISETVNQWGEYRTVLDVNEPMTNLKNYVFAFRVVGLVDYGNSWQYNQKIRTYAFHPSFLAKYRNNTVVHIGYDVQKILHNSQNYSPMTPSGGLWTGWGRREGGFPPGDQQSMERRGVRLEVEQTFLDNWQTRFEATGWSFQRYGVFVRPVTGYINWINQTETYLAEKDDEPEDEWFIEDDTTGHYHIGPVQLESLFGFNMADEVTENKTSTIGPARLAFTPDNSNVRAIPMTQAGVNSLPVPNPLDFTYGGTDPTRNKTLINNVYYQERVDAIPRYLTLIGDVTWATIETIRDTNLNISSPYGATDLPGQAWLHRLGGTLHLTKDIVLYALESTSYSAQGGVNYSNSRLPNVNAKDDEVGIKTALMDGRISSEFSVYKITQTNQTVTGVGLNPFGSSFAVPIGTTTNRGWDGDIEFSILPAWQLVVTGYNGTVRDQTGNFMIPFTYDNSWSAFTQYQFDKSSFKDNSWLKGLRVGGGTFRLGSFWQSTAGYIVPAGYILRPVVKMQEGNMIDLFIDDKFDKHWSAKLNIINVLNQAFGLGGQSARDLDPSPPTTFSLQIEYRL